MTWNVLRADDASWRPSNQLGVLNTDVAVQLGASGAMGARLWRLEPGQWSTRHRHGHTAELYVLVEGTGRIRIEDELLTLAPLDMVFVEPEHVRQVFNDGDTPQLWLVIGTPPEAANTLNMEAAQLEFLYPQGPKAPPPELSGA